MLFCHGIIIICTTCNTITIIEAGYQSVNHWHASMCILYTGAVKQEYNVHMARLIINEHCLNLYSISVITYMFTLLCCHLDVYTSPELWPESEGLSDDVVVVSSMLWAAA